jgi:hypothetical protein
MDTLPEFSWKRNLNARHRGWQLRRERLDAFARAVWGKANWPLKVCDGRNLLAKWADEAQLAKGADLDATIR